MPEVSSSEVFISYNENDQLAAEEIASRLRDTYDIKVWLLAWSVTPGRLTQAEQEKGLTQSNACAVLLGQAGVQGWQQLELYASIRERIDTKGSNFPVIPVYLPDCPAEVKTTVPPLLKIFEPVTFGGLDDDEALRRLKCSIRGEPPGQETPADLPCPFPGLDPFREDMAKYFFGRDDEIEQLCEMLANRPPFVLVLGPSGIGKSSLVLAGIIPRLRGETEQPYLIHVLNPGREPLQALARLFVSSPADQKQRDELAAAFAADDHKFGQVLEAELKQQPASVRRVLLVIDQLEEVFSQCQDVGQRGAFIRNILSACQASAGSIQAVLTLRSDFFTPCFTYPDLVEPRRQFPLGALRGELLRRAIEESGQQAGLIFQSGLVTTLLDDMDDEPGSLSLIQYTLRQLFDQRSGRWLTFDAYEKLGGVSGVIANRAEATLARLKANSTFRSDQVESIVRRIMLRLVQVSENSPPTRQQVARPEFFWSSDTPEQHALLEAALDLLIEDHLFTTGDDSQISLAHEVIIKAWRRLADWVSESTHDLLIRQQIEGAARQWDKQGRSKSMLYRGVQLERALEWQKRRI